ncbi:myosin, partial [Cystoisospora suis]
MAETSFSRPSSSSHNSFAVSSAMSSSFSSSSFNSAKVTSYSSSSSSSVSSSRLSSRYSTSFSCSSSSSFSTSARPSPHSSSSFSSPHSRHLHHDPCSPLPPPISSSSSSVCPYRSLVGTAVWVAAQHISSFSSSSRHGDRGEESLLHSSAQSHNRLRLSPSSSSFLSHSSSSASHFRSPFHAPTHRKDGHSASSINRTSSPFLSSSSSSVLSRHSSTCSSSSPFSYHLPRPSFSVSERTEDTPGVSVSPWSVQTPGGGAAAGPGVQGRGPTETSHKFSSTSEGRWMSANKKIDKRQRGSSSPFHTSSSSGLHDDKEQRDMKTLRHLTPYNSKDFLTLENQQSHKPQEHHLRAFYPGVIVQPPSVLGCTDTSSGTTVTASTSLYREESQSFTEPPNSGTSSDLKHPRLLSSPKRFIKGERKESVHKERKEEEKGKNTKRSSELNGSHKNPERRPSPTASHDLVYVRVSLLHSPSSSYPFSTASSSCKEREEKKEEERKDGSEEESEETMVMAVRLSDLLLRDEILGNADDNTQLQHLNEANLLENLRCRYTQAFSSSFDHSRQEQEDNEGKTSPSSPNEEDLEHLQRRIY